MSWLAFGPNVRGRMCGSCTACCTQVPVQRLPWGDKPANVRCPKLCSRGCSIYARRPEPCRYWSCRWLFDETTKGLRRPDRSGYIVDPMLDTIVVEHTQRVEVIQVWIDPARPDAHRAPELRAWLGQMAELHGLPAIVRWNSDDGMVLAAPCLNETKTGWLEIGSTLVGRGELQAKVRRIEAGAAYG
jgi:hypothetical protein